MHSHHDHARSSRTIAVAVDSANVERQILQDWQRDMHPYAGLEDAAELKHQVIRLGWPILRRLCALGHDVSSATGLMRDVFAIERDLEAHKRS